MFDLRVLLAAVLLWVVIIAGCQHATAAPTTPQELADETALFVADVLNIEPTFMRLDLRPSHDLVYAMGGQVECYGDVIDADERIRWFGPNGRPTRAAGQLLIHELAHAAGRRLKRPGCIPDRAVEEGVVEAFTEDVYPAWSKRFRGFAEQPGYVPEYLVLVRNVRGWSAAYTGTPRNPRTGAARRAIRELLLATTERRHAMLTTIEGGAR